MASPEPIRIRTLEDAAHDLAAPHPAPIRSGSKSKDNKDDEERKRQEEAKRKAEEARRSEETKKAAETQKAQEVQKKPEAPKPQEEAAKAKTNTEELDTGRGNKSGFGYDKAGTYDVARAAREGENAAARAESFKIDPYANSLQDRSFPQATAYQRNHGELRGTADEAADLRRAGRQNLQNDVDFLARQHGVGPSRHGFDIGGVGAKQEYQRNEVAKIIQEKTGVKMEPTGGLGNYSERDMGKILATPEARQYMDSIKLGKITPDKMQQPSGTLSEQKAQRMKETSDRIANNKTDYTKDVERVASGNPNLTPIKDTTKGPRLDTRSNANIVSAARDPLQGLASGMRVKNEKATEYGGTDPLEPKTRELRQPGMYDPALGTQGSLAYSKYANVPTNKPATSVEELNSRMGALEKDRIANADARATRQAQIAAGTIKRGATLPGGEFIANQPKQKAGMETDAQRIARRAKEEGVGQFAGSAETRRSPSQSLSYFDDKSRGKRI